MPENEQPDKLVTVLESDDQALILVAKSLLDDAGIPYSTNGEDLQYAFGWGTFGVGLRPLVQFQVTAENAKDARALLSDLRTEGEKA
ncbi:MAG: DUF2007 domain-containing protein [Terriglobia bacterium]